MKPKCHNCKFAGDQFKIGKLIHQHCFHSRYTPENNGGELPNPWETLREFSDTCNEHQFKEHDTKSNPPYPCI